jgi:hypothetical protein
VNLRITTRVQNGKKTLLVAVAALALGGWGCRGRSEGFERYVPASGPARAAVAAVLDAWRDGRSPGDGVGPRGDIHVVDHQRRPGQKLTRYEILGEVAADDARAFAVRLTFTDPDEEQVARLLAVGLDPLWVFRQEDFEMISHWMHKMDDDENHAPSANPRP